MIHLRHSGWMERKIGQQWSRKMPEEKNTRFSKIRRATGKNKMTGSKAGCITHRFAHVQLNGSY